MLHMHILQNGNKGKEKKTLNQILKKILINSS